MRKPNYFILALLFLVLFSSRSIGQTLPEYKTMLNQGVPYNAVKAAVESSIDSIMVNDTTEGSEMNEYQRWLGFWNGRAYGEDGITPGSAVQYKKAMFNYYNLNSCQNNSDTPEWEFLGPTRITKPNTNIPVSVIGRVNAVAMHPSNTNVMYLGTSSSGVWKTANAQAPEPVWANISDGYGFDNIAVTDIAIDPSNPNKIYVSTGPVSYGYGIGVLVSNNGGASWLKTTLAYFDDSDDNSESVTQLRIDPVNTNTVWAMYHDKVEKSTDGGQTWAGTNFQSAVNNGNIALKNMEIHRGNSNIVYVSGTEIWKSVSGVWTRIDQGMHSLVPISAIGTLVGRDFRISSDHLGVYVLSEVAYTEPDPNDPNKTLTFKRWDLLRYTENNNSWTYLRTQDYMVPKFIVSPVDPNVIYYMDIPYHSFVPYRGRNVAKSLNAGDTAYEQGFYRPYSIFYGVSTHPDIRDLELISASSGGLNDMVLAGTDGGILYSEESETNINRIKWQNKNGTGLNITEFYGVTTLKYESEYVALGAQDNSRFTLIDGIWRNYVLGDGYDGFIVRTDTMDTIWGQINFPTNSSSIDLGSKSFKQRDLADHSKNGGIESPEWWSVTKRPSQIMKNGDVYIGRYDLSKKTAGTNNYTVISDFDAMGVGHRSVLVDISVYEKNDDIIFAAFPGATWDSLSNTVSPKKKFYRTTNGGTSWDEISVEFGGEFDILHGHGIKSVLVNPNDSNEVWLGLDNRAWESQDTTKGIKRVVRTKNALSSNPTWTDYSEGLPTFPVEEIIFDEMSDGMLYVATDVGIFFRNSSDANSKWKCFNNGLPHISVSDIDINYCLRKIYAATHGRGLWSADLLTPGKIFAGNANGEVWNTDQKFYQTIHIKPGDKLTINNATISMAAGTKIIVDQGAELVLNSSIITNECGAFWDGIEVWGNSEFSINTQYCPSGSSCLVGKLTMNHSTIENADNAVRLWNPDDWNMRGGMIYASSSFFKNNRRDVEFMAFENHYDSGPNIGQVAPYRSAFYKCDFIIDQNYLFDVKPPRDAMVTMWQVRGIDFDGCDFRNISGQSLNKAGIYSWDADYTVKEWCNQYPCNNPVQSHFIGLKAGIDATSSGMGYGFMVDTSSFINCDYGVVVNGVQNAVITRNSFSLDANGFGVQPPSSIGIYLNSADLFTVEQNKLDGLTTGILARSTGGTYNEIRKNGFVNAYHGNMAYKDNNDPLDPKIGLQYNCNLHQNPGIYDITIHGGTGIAKNQGSFHKAADNAFTNSSSLFPEKHIANNSSIGVIMNYFHHNNSAGYILEPTDIDPLKVINQVVNGQFDENDNCLSSIDHFLSQDRGHMDQQKGESERRAFNGAKANYHQAKYVYTSTIDGGDTYGLLNTVQNSHAQDAWSLRNDLINDSPLSDEVIIGVINDGLLSNSLLLDVLMVNSHASRNEEIINRLETKPVPMPAYMINTFLGLFEVLSQRDVLEAEIAHEAIAMNKSARLLITHWLADSTGGNLDSIPALLAEIPNPMADLQRIAYYRSMKNVEQADQIMSDIVNQHELTSWQEDMISGVEDMYVAYDQTISGGKKQLYELSPATEATLSNYSQEIDTRKGVYAKSWLKFSKEELFLPDMVTYDPPSDKRLKQSIFELREIEEETIFEIFPNPAQDYITVQNSGYESENNIKIEIISSLGEVVLTNFFLNRKSQNINLSQFSSGIYVIRILDGEHEVQKQILEIIK